MRPTASDISGKYRTLIRRVVWGILLTGVLASVVTLLPLSYHISQSQDRTGLAYASAQAMSLRLGREVSDAEAALAYHLGWHCTDKEE